MTQQDIELAESIRPVLPTTKWAAINLLEIWNRYHDPKRPATCFCDQQERNAFHATFFQWWDSTSPTTDE